MDLFGRDRAVKRLEDTVDRLEKLLEQHEARLNEMDHIEVEWADWFEKYKNLYSRLNRRVSRDEPKEEPEEPISPAAQRIFNARGI